MNEIIIKIWNNLAPIATSSSTSASTSSSSSSVNQSSVASGILFTALINTLITIGILIVFFFYLRRYVYAFKPIHPIFPKEPYVARPPRNLSERIYKWLKFALEHDPVEYGPIIREHGRRVATQLFLYQQFILATLVCAFLAVTILLPIHLTGEIPSNHDRSWLAYTTVDSVISRPDYLIAHVIMAIIFVFVYLFFIQRWRSSPIVLYTASETGSPRVSDLSVQVIGLPKSFTDDRALFDAFDRLYPQQVLAAHIPVDVSRYLDIKSRIERGQRGYEYYQKENRKNDSRKKKFIFRKSCWPIARVDAEMYFYDMKTQAENEMQQWKAQATRSSGGYGYVTFKNVRTAERCVKDLQRNQIRLAAHNITQGSSEVRGVISSIPGTAKNTTQSLLSQVKRSSSSSSSTENDTEKQSISSDNSGHVIENVEDKHSYHNMDVSPSPVRSVPEYYNVTFAPEPFDIRWKHVTFNVLHKTTRHATVHIIIIFFLLFLTTPAATFSGIKSLFNVSPISDTIGFVNNLSASVGGSFLLGLVFQYLPSFSLYLVSELIPKTIKWLTKWEGYTLTSKTKRVTFTRMYIYSILNVLILPSLLLQSFDAVIEWLITNNVSEGMGRLFLPESGALFLNLMLQYFLFKNTLDLLCWEDFIMYKFKQYTARTKMDKEEAFNELDYSFPGRTSNLLTVFSIMIVYSVFSPLIIVIGLAFLIYRAWVDYQLMIHIAHKCQPASHEWIPDAHAWNKEMNLIVRYAIVDLLLFLGALMLFFGTSIGSHGSFTAHFVVVTIAFGCLLAYLILWNTSVEKRHPVATGIRPTPTEAQLNEQWRQGEVHIGRSGDHFRDGEMDERKDRDDIFSAETVEEEEEEEESDDLEYYFYAYRPTFEKQATVQYVAEEE